MEFSTAQRGRFTVLSPHGRLGFDEASEAQKVIEDQVQACDMGVIVDCSELRFLSSAGLRAFLLGAKAAQQRGVTFCACNLDENIKSVFTISGFDRVVPLFTDTKDAIERLQ